MERAESREQTDKGSLFGAAASSTPAVPTVMLCAHMCNQLADAVCGEMDTARASARVQVLEIPSFLSVFFFLFFLNICSKLS